MQNNRNATYRFRSSTPVMLFARMGLGCNIGSSTYCKRNIYAYALIPDNRYTNNVLCAFNFICTHAMSANINLLNISA